MCFIDIFPYLNCFNLFKANVTQSIKPMNYVYPLRLIKSRWHALLQGSLRTAFKLLNPSTILNTGKIWKTNQRRSCWTTVWANSSRKITWLWHCSSFQKALLWKVQLYVYNCFLQLFSHISSGLLCLNLMKLNQLGQWIVFNLPDYKRPVYVTPERFQNGRIHSENAWNVFRPHYAHEEEIWKRATITASDCDLCVRKSWAVKSHGYIVQSPLRKALE